MDIIGAMTTLAKSLSFASKLVETAKRLGVPTEKALDIFKRKKGWKDKKYLNNQDNLEAILAVLQIPEDILDQLAKEAEACKKKYKKRRNAAKTDDEFTFAETQASQCVCNKLKTMIRHNDGKLPAFNEFQKMWVAFSCQEEA